MDERKISASTVADALRNPDSIMSGTEGKTICLKKFDTKTLKIVFREYGFKRKREYVIITVFYK
jgi:hypothetical protein